MNEKPFIEVRTLLALRGAMIPPRSGGEKEENKKANMQRLLAIVAENPLSSTREIADKSCLSTTHVRDLLNELEKMGLIKAVRAKGTQANMPFLFSITLTGEQEL